MPIKKNLSTFFLLKVFCGDLDFVFFSLRCLGDQLLHGIAEVVSHRLQY